jgi:HD-like signal output (HDOD) protein
VDQNEENEMTTETANDPTQPVDVVLEQTIREIDIPPRPVIIDRIRNEMNRDIPNFKYVGQLISADVSLAAGLIKTANSPYFGFQKPARSVAEALLMLGLDVTSRAVAAISLRRAFPNSAHYERFWDASARIAMLSGWLAQRVRKSKLRADDAYTYGLFRDCGIVILMRRFPAYLKTLDRANNEGEKAFTAVEHEDFPTDHTVLGCMLAQNWWLPEEICQAIRHHHDQPAIDHFESGMPLASRYLVAASQTAEHILQQLTGGSQTMEWAKLGPSCLRLLGLDEAELAAIYLEAEAVLTNAD